MTGDPSDSSADKLPRRSLTLRVVLCYLSVFGVALAIAAQYSMSIGFLVATLALIVGELFQGRPRSAFAAGGGMLLLTLCLPAMDDSLQEARLKGCLVQMRQIQLAIFNYEQAHGHWPPPFSVDEKGRPLHSWRVLILPYMGDPELQSLYEKIDLTKPWSDPKNLAVGNQMPGVYRCPAFTPRFPGDEHSTAYVAVVGPETLWRPPQPLKLANQQIDPSGNLSIVEAERFRLHWMLTADPSIDVLTGGAAVSLLKPGPHRGGYSVCAFADVHTKAIRDDLSVENLRRMLTTSAPETAQQATTQSADSGR